MNLGDVRARIDGIDRQIQELIAERAGWAHQVGKAKGPLKAAVDYYRPERESQVLRMVIDRNEGPLSDEVLVRRVSRNHVGVPGPAGAAEGRLSRPGGHVQRSRRCTSTSAIPRTACRWRASRRCSRKSKAGHADFGVVPVENSGQGTIQVTLDMFLTSNLKICGEVELRVRQYLLSRTGHIEDIERIYSHPQSFAQTKAWLRANLPKAEKIPVSSNAEAARRARNADDAAAIAGEAAGHVYGLRKVIVSPIEDRDDNTTRFLVLGRQFFPSSGHDRTSILVSIRDQPGALFNALSPFARHGISMNRIESRPSHHAKWEYAFFIDLAGHIDDVPMKKALAELEPHTAEIKILGSYPVAVL